MWNVECGMGKFDSLDYFDFLEFLDNAVQTIFLESNKNKEMT